MCVFLLFFVNQIPGILFIEILAWMWRTSREMASVVEREFCLSHDAPYTGFSALWTRDTPDRTIAHSLPPQSPT